MSHYEMRDDSFLHSLSVHVCTPCNSPHEALPSALIEERPVLRPPLIGLGEEYVHGGEIDSDKPNCLKDKPQVISSEKLKRNVQIPVEIQEPQLPDQAAMVMKLPCRYEEPPDHPRDDKVAGLHERRCDQGQRGCEEENDGRGGRDGLRRAG